MKKYTLSFFILLVGLANSQSQTLFKLHCGSTLPGNRFEGIAIIPNLDKTGSVSTYKPTNNHFSANRNYILALDSVGVESWSKVIKIDSNFQQINNLNDTSIITEKLNINFTESSQQLGYLLCSTKDSLVYYKDTSAYWSAKLYSCINVSLIDSVGTLVWSRNFSNNGNLIPLGMTCGVNEIYIVGVHANPDTNATLYLLKLDSNGNILWSNSISTFYNKATKASLNFKNSQLTVAASIGNDVIVFQVDSNGNITWSNKYDSAFNDALIDLVSSDDGFIVGMNSSLVSNLPILLKLDTLGIIQNAIQMPGAFYSLNRLFKYNNHLLAFTNMEFFAQPILTKIDELWYFDLSLGYLFHETFRARTYNFTVAVSSLWTKSITSNSTGLLEMTHFHSDSRFSFGDIDITEINQLDSVGRSCSSFSIPTLPPSSINQQTIWQAPLLLGKVNFNCINFDETLILYDSAFAPVISCSGQIGINDLSNELYSFAIYPNPSTGIFNLEFEDATVKEIEVYTMQGRSVYKARVNSQTTSINLAHLSAGLYYVQATTAQGTGTVKLVKE